jgi:integrin beta 2
MAHIFWVAAAGLDSYTNTTNAPALPTSYYSYKGASNHEADCVHVGGRLASKNCDGHLDCADGADEFYCSNFACDMYGGAEVIGYACADGSCRGNVHRCDGTADCPDGSDEVGCRFECVLPKGGRGVLCSGDSGLCIHRSRACDGKAQCPDGSDEFGCDFECLTPSGVLGHRCGDGTCVSPSDLCDGKPRCSNGRDETACSFTCMTNDGVPGFPCADDDHTCIRGDQVKGRWVGGMSRMQ